MGKKEPRHPESFIQRVRRSAFPPSVDAFDGRISGVENLINSELSALNARLESMEALIRKTGAAQKFVALRAQAKNATQAFPKDSDPDRKTKAPIERLLEKTSIDAYPSANESWVFAKEIDLMKYNIKATGYRLARELASQFPVSEHTSPRPLGFTSRATKQCEFEQEWFAHWCSQLKIPMMFHRKLWEYAFVLQTLFDCDLLKPGVKGVGFGCGHEPLPSYFAALGMNVTVTDLDPLAVKGAGWAETGQHSDSLESLYMNHLVSREAFASRVELRYVDMNAIPEDLAGYDFCWSICALEHLGSIANGLGFIENSLKCIKKGGLALHTTEFNYMNDDETIDNRPTVLFQRRHFDEIAARLRSAGHEVAPLNFDVGSDPMDTFIDLPPYEWQMGLESRSHLKLALDGFPSTCFGIAVRKN